MDKNVKRFKVKIFSPYQTYYQGEAVSLSAANRTGPFDILPGHINFFSLLSGGTVVLNTGFQRLEFPLARGIIRVNFDDVTLFADV
jgi:F0F1-type ATP synthase epsilon subunit